MGIARWMMGSSGDLWGYYPQDSNGLAVQNAPAEPCACPVFAPTNGAVYSLLVDGGCGGGQCEEMPPQLPPAIFPVCCVDLCATAP